MYQQDQKQIVLKPNTVLSAASYRADYDLKVEYAGGNDDRLWLFGQEFGPLFVIAADSFQDAWEAAVDSLPTIDPAEVPEAYGFDSQAELDAAIEAAEAGERDYPELLEGYEYQSNVSGTGIVDAGYYAWLHELTPALVRDWEIRLVIEAV